jgi:glycosyltransferase involved in cell wall biosynthesis
MSARSSEILMRIALISTCAVAVPPAGYGGTELVTAELAKMLTRRGHEVVVYATGNSNPGCPVRYHFAEPVWPPDANAELCHAAFAWQDIARQSNPFHIVHAHDLPSVALGLLQGTPLVLTLHHKREERFVDFYRDFPDVAYVAISHRQAELVPELGIPYIVHHGIDVDRYPAGDGNGGYVAFLGRLAPEKGPHVAIDTARDAGVHLMVGGEAHDVEKVYFEREVRPRLVAGAARGEVEWLGEIGHDAKVALLQGASALLFPIDWEEPFGLVMIEAMLTGTPVLAFPRGSVPEVIEDGVTGFIVSSPAEMGARVRKLDGFDRVRCRARAAEYWNSLRMAQDYEWVYHEVLRARRQGPLRAPRTPLTSHVDEETPWQVVPADRRAG